MGCKRCYKYAKFIFSENTRNSDCRIQDFENKLNIWDISNWDVSNVTNMDFMFYNCIELDSDISQWDVSNVTSNDDMFYKCGIREEFKPIRFRNIPNTTPAATTTSSGSCPIRSGELIIPERGNQPINDNEFHNISRSCSYPLTDVIIPNGVTIIGEEAFSENMYLTVISIPNTVRR